MTDEPQVLTTTTTGSTEPPVSQDGGSASWQPDIAALQNAKGDPRTWAKQFAELVGHTTGSWIDEATFVDWLGLFSQQVAQATSRVAMLQVANTVLPYEVAGDPAVALMALRDQIAQSFRRGAGL